MAGRLFGERFDQSILALADELFQRGGDFGVIHCISDIIPWPGAFRPERYVKDQTLRLRALTIRHTDAHMNFKLFDVDAVYHTAGILIRRSAESEGFLLFTWHD